MSHVHSERFSEKRYFLITTHGYTGSVWFAYILHQHPDIKCSVGTDALPVSLSYHCTDDEVAKALFEDQSWVKNGLSGKQQINSLLDKYFAEKAIDAEKYAKYKSLVASVSDRDNAIHNFLFSELRESPIKNNASFIGNVHAMGASNCKNIIKNSSKPFGVDKFVVLDLIRNPITRLDSQINYNAQTYQNSPSFKEMVDKRLNENAQLALSIEKKYGVDFSISRNKVHFYHDYFDNYLLGISHDTLHTLDIPKITFEKLRSDPIYFKIVLENIMHGLSPDNDYIDFAFKPESLNFGRMSSSTHRKDRTDPMACFQSWSDWEKDRFRQHVKEHDLAKFYLKFGYDLSGL